MEHTFIDTVRLPDKKPTKTTIPLDPVDFFNECLLKSRLIKNKADRKQFMEWASRFKDEVEMTQMSQLDCGDLVVDSGYLPIHKYEKPLYIYYIFTPIILDGVDAITRIESNGTMTLSKGELLFGKYNGPDDIFPMEIWTEVANAKPYQMLDIIVDQYNNVDNRYRCKIHGEIRYKRHNGPWTSK